MSHAILAVGDSYLSAEDMAPHLSALNGEFSVRFRTVNSDDRPELPGVREYQGSPEVLAGWLEGEDVLLVHAAPVTDELLAAHPEIRVVACARGGAVNIDLEAAKRRGVVVLNTPAKNAQSVADLTMTSIHLLFRGVSAAQGWLRAEAEAGRTHLDSTFVGGNFIATEPSGHTLGLVGFGAIGRRVAEQASFYGMTVLAADPFAPPQDDGVEFVELDELLRRSDVVSLHAPALDETRGIANADFFARMRRGAYFINTARESLLVEDALVDALVAGHLAGAALDVCEPDGRWPELVRMPNVFVTPHLGGATVQTQARSIRMLVEDLQRWSVGEPPVRRIA